MDYKDTDDFLKNLYGENYHNNITMHKRSSSTRDIVETSVRDNKYKASYRITHNPAVNEYRIAWEDESAIKDLPKKVINKFKDFFGVDEKD